MCNIVNINIDNNNNNTFYDTGFTVFTYFKSNITLLISLNN